MFGTQIRCLPLVCGRNGVLMKKINLLLTVAAMLFVGVAGFQTGAVTLSVNGTPKEIAAYEIKGNNYFKLRDMAQLLNGTSAQFDVLWDETSKAINLVSGAPYSGTDVLNPATISDAVAASNATRILKDGANVAMCAYMIEGNNFFKLRDLAAVMDFAVTYDAATGLIGMDTTKSYEFPAVPTAFAVNPEPFYFSKKIKKILDKTSGLWYTKRTSVGGVFLLCSFLCVPRGILVTKDPCRRGR